MQTLYMASHAESIGQLSPRRVDDLSENTPLTGKGQYQAQALGTWIHENLPPITQVISSSARSSLETAKIAVNSAFFDQPEITQDIALARMTGDDAGELIFAWTHNLVTKPLSADEIASGSERRTLVIVNKLAIASLAGRFRNSSQRDIRTWQITDASINTFEFDAAGEPISIKLNQQTEW